MEKTQKKGLKRKVCEVVYANPILRHKNDKDKDITINSIEFTIGRGVNNNCVLNDLSISRCHCVCFMNKLNDDWFLTDRSSAGTVLNKVKLKPNTPYKLCSGDEIQLGNEEEFTYIFMSDIKPNKVETSIKNASIDENKPSNNYIPSKKVKKENVIEEIETLKLEKKELLESLRQQNKQYDKLCEEKEGLEKKFSKFCDNVEENLTCAICNEMFIKSTMLNCSHTFCKSCIEQWKKTKKQCPICRAKILKEYHVFTLDNMVTSRVEASSEEAKNRRQEIVEERSVQELLSEAPSRRGATSSGRGRRGRTRRTAPTRNGANFVLNQPNEVIVLDDTQTGEPSHQFPNETIEILSDENSDFGDDMQYFGAVMFDEFDMLENFLSYHGTTDEDEDDIFEADEFE